MLDNRYVINDARQASPHWSSGNCASFTNPDILAFHQALPGYAPTPLVSLPGLAGTLGLKNILVKDESHRFGINAFKGLGASYAIFRFLKKTWEATFSTPFTVATFKTPSEREKLGQLTFCAATDGNHGKAVAWTARMLGQKAVIYMPDNTVPSRVSHIENEGAHVVLVGGTFDDCVSKADADARSNGWHAIADTAFEGYMEIPNDIMAGYSTLFRELDNEETPDLVLLQAGVGGLAAAGTWYFTHRFKESRPAILCVEPTECDGFLESALHHKVVQARGNHESIMAGLNCGIPSLVAWPICRDAMDAFMAVTDNYAEAAMCAFHYNQPGDDRITSGESGASGLAGLIALMTHPTFAPLKQRLGINKTSTVLVVNTEGDTDPINYKKIIEKKTMLFG